MRHLVCGAHGSHPEALTDALSRAFRGRFTVEDGSACWYPPAGLGSYTLERIKSFADGWAAARR